MQVMMRKCVPDLLLWVFLLTLLGSPCLGVPVWPGIGITFQQIDYTWESAETLDSNVGRLVVDVATIIEVTGISFGYLNIATPQGWIVQDLPLSVDFPYETIATHFQLSDSSSPGPISTLEVFIDIATLPRGVHLFVAGQDGALGGLELARAHQKQRASGMDEGSGREAA